VSRFDVRLWWVDVVAVMGGCDRCGGWLGECGGWYRGG